MHTQNSLCTGLIHTATTRLKIFLVSFVAVYSTMLIPATGASLIPAGRKAGYVYPFVVPFARAAQRHTPASPSSPIPATSTQGDQHTVFILLIHLFINNWHSTPSKKPSLFLFHHRLLYVREGGDLWDRGLGRVLNLKLEITEWMLWKLDLWALLTRK